MRTIAFLALTLVACATGVPAAPPGEPAPPPPKGPGIAAPGTPSADDWVRRGVDARSAGRSEDAEVAFNQAIKLDPRHPDVWFDLGNLMLSQRRFAEALEQYERALHLRADDDDAALNAGHALMGIGRHEQAEGAFDRLTQRAPHRGDAWQALGVVRHELGDVAGAIEAFRKAHALNPMDIAARFNLGMALSDGLLHRDAAAAEFDEAIEHLVACVEQPTPGMSEVNVRKRLLKLRRAKASRSR